MPQIEPSARGSSLPPALPPGPSAEPSTLVHDPSLSPLTTSVPHEALGITERVDHKTVSPLGDTDAHTDHAQSDDVKSTPCPLPSGVRVVEVLDKISNAQSLDAEASFKQHGSKGDESECSTSSVASTTPATDSKTEDAPTTPVEIEPQEKDSTDDLNEDEASSSEEKAERSAIPRAPRLPQVQPSSTLPLPSFPAPAMPMTAIKASSPPKDQVPDLAAKNDEMDVESEMQTSTDYLTGCQPQPSGFSAYASDSSPFTTSSWTTPATGLPLVPAGDSTQNPPQLPLIPAFTQDHCTLSTQNPHPCFNSIPPHTGTSAWYQPQPASASPFDHMQGVELNPWSYGLSYTSHPQPQAPAAVPFNQTHPPTSVSREDPVDMDIDSIEFTCSSEGLISFINQPEETGTVGSMEEDEELQEQGALTKSNKTSTGRPGFGSFASGGSSSAKSTTRAAEASLSHPQDNLGATDTPATSPCSQEAKREPGMFDPDEAMRELLEEFSNEYKAQASGNGRTPESPDFPPVSSLPILPPVHNQPIADAPFEALLASGQLASDGRDGDNVAMPVTSPEHVKVHMSFGSRPWPDIMKSSNEVERGEEIVWNLDLDHAFNLEKGKLISAFLSTPSLLQTLISIP